MRKHFRYCTATTLPDGATAVEYGLMAALIGLTIFGAVSSVGQGIKNTLYGQIVTALQNMGK